MENNFSPPSNRATTSVKLVSFRLAFPPPNLNTPIRGCHVNGAVAVNGGRRRAVLEPRHLRDQVGFGADNALRFLRSQKTQISASDLRRRHCCSSQPQNLRLLRCFLKWNFQEEKRVADDERRWRMKAVEEVLELGLHLCHDGFNDVVV
ncbi:uncharacterized protein LOC114369698 [Glycine soja]|uniref:Uncharacterized protein n=1 Tax=Glycine soja TaxID=3848 RepID=A0A445INP5_GLYSO|nr:uncharacterized protein LOC114369698 [Glycine soja]RZB87634.1 hypothetical protein D0Y65_027292 [Glycine soja]